MHTRKKIILDFDGTIFRLFTNYDLGKEAIKLQEMFKQYDIDFDCNLDPFVAFNIALNTNNHIKEEVLYKVNEIITKAEIAALDSGVLVPGFLEFIEFSNEFNFSVSVVSNNSKECIDEFFNRFFCNIKIPCIGRIWNKPQYMKPNTYLLETMCDKLHASNKDVIFIGDNPRDYECAIKFNCEFIGMAPTLAKKKRILENTSNIKVLSNFYELIDYLKKNI